MMGYRRRATLIGSLAALLVAPPATSSAGVHLDLNALITRECGPPGFKTDSGCSLDLGPGTFNVAETVTLGGCTSGTVRNSVTLQGTSAGMLASFPGGITTLKIPTAGTTLRWTGPSGQAMFAACGASFLSFRDLLLDAANAAVAIRISADSRTSAISHFVEVRNVVIDGAEIGIYVTGRNYSDQADFVTLNQVAITNVDTGYLQDSQQSVGGRAQTVEVIARRRGFEIRNGSLNCDNCYVGTAAEAGDDFIAFHLRRGSQALKPWETHHQVGIEHSQMELQAGRFIVAEAEAHFPITLIGNSYGLHCPRPFCEMSVVDSRSKAPIVMIGDVIQGLDQQPRARICHRGHELVRLGVKLKPEVAVLSVGCATP